MTASVLRRGSLSLISPTQGSYRACDSPCFLFILSMLALNGALGFVALPCPAPLSPTFGQTEAFACDNDVYPCPATRHLWESTLPERLDLHASQPNFMGFTRQLLT